MSRDEARKKGWETWKKNLVQYASEHPEFSLDDFILDRAETGFYCWRDARLAERNKDFERARGLYLKASESLAQVESLKEHDLLPPLLEKLKAEYYDFVVHRDPIYRLHLKYPLMSIKEKPGILQTDLYKEFASKRKETISYVLYFAEKEGLIRREKQGRTYSLFFERDKADEPFQKFQDDDIDIEEKAASEAALRKGCLFIFTYFFWFILLVVIGSYTGLVGAGIVVAAFIAWKIFRLIQRKRRNTVVKPESDLQK